MRAIPIVFGVLASAAGAANAAKKEDRAFFAVAGLILGYGVGSALSDINDAVVPPNPDDKAK